MIYDFFGNIFEKISLFFNIEQKYALLLLIPITGYFHFNTFKNWKNANKNSKYWTKLGIVIVVIILIGFIFD